MLRKNKSVWLVLLAVLLIVFCGVRLYRVQAAQNNYINSNVPTLFFHGWGSSYRAERQIANYAKNKGVTNTIIRADVSAKGEVELIGSMKKNAKNPALLFGTLKTRRRNHWKSRTSGREVSSAVRARKRGDICRLSCGKDRIQKAVCGQDKCV